MRLVLLYVTDLSGFTSRKKPTVVYAFPEYTGSLAVFVL